MNFRQWTVITVFPLSVLLLAFLAFVPATSSPAFAQQGDSPQVSSDSDDPAEALTRKERKLQAKEQRIEEYLRKKEEKRVRKEQSEQVQQQEHSEAAARELEAQQLAQTPPPPAPTVQSVPAPVATTTAEVQPRSAKKKRSSLPRNLARAQDNVRATQLALDPTVQEYLVLIDQQTASAHQLAAFANFLAQHGLVRDGLQYYEVALSIEASDPVLWINAGTMHQQLNDFGAAESAYTRALSLNPNSAAAHYNLGTVLKEMNRYDDALAAYKAALFLDPTLGDPTINPQATNNNLLTAVKLMLYQEQVGSLSLPLIDVTGPGSYGIPPATE